MSSRFASRLVSGVAVVAAAVSVGACGSGTQQDSAEAGAQATAR